MAKFTYKGKSGEDIEKLSMEEFSELLTSRVRRSLKRGLPESQKKLLEEIRKKPDGFHKTHCREMVILPEMLNKKIGN